MTMVEAAPKRNRKVAVREPQDLMQALIQTISNPEFDIEKLRQLRDIYNSEVADKRRIEYDSAMSACQRDIPIIKSNKVNPDTNSRYADLAQMNRVLAPIYSKHGFAVSFGMDAPQIEGCYGVTAKVTHRGGHSEKFRADVPIDDKGKGGNKNKTMVHGFGSTLSYAQRYMLKLIFNVSIEGEDKDGNQPDEAVSEDQVAELRRVISEHKLDEAGFCQLAKIEHLEELPMRKFDSAMNHLLQAAKARGQGKHNA